MICVLTPSRGLVHSRTVEEVARELHGHDYRWLLSHGLPIPDCFNDLVDRALRTDCRYLLFIEDDMHLPKGIVQKLFEARADIALADYPVRKTQRCVGYLNGEFAYGGTGLLLVKREVFDSLLPPYFRTHISYQIQDNKLIPTPSVVEYGLHDVDFYQRTKDFVRVVIDQDAGQYFLKKPDLPKYNNDTANEYEVELWQL